MKLKVQLEKNVALLEFPNLDIMESFCRALVQSMNFLLPLPRELPMFQRLFITLALRRDLRFRFSAEVIQVFPQGPNQFGTALTVVDWSKDHTQELIQKVRQARTMPPEAPDPREQPVDEQGALLAFLKAGSSVAPKEEAPLRYKLAEQMGLWKRGGENMPAPPPTAPVVPSPPPPTAPRPVSSPPTPTQQQPLPEARSQSAAPPPKPTPAASPPTIAASPPQPGPEARPQPAAPSPKASPSAQASPPLPMAPPQKEFSTIPAPPPAAPPPKPAPPRVRERHSNVFDLPDANQQPERHLDEAAILKLKFAAIQANPEQRKELLESDSLSTYLGLLANPGLTLEELLGLLESPAISTTLLERIALDRRWSKDYAVQKALCLHPWTPMSVVLRFIENMRPKDAYDIAYRLGTRETVKRAALRTAAKNWASIDPPRIRKISV